LLKNVLILDPGPNVQFQLDPATNTITLDAIGNEDFMADCVCAGSRNTGECIKTINGVAPTSAGDFTIQPGRDCLSISGLDAGLLISDSCSAPCCGCTELDIINTALQTVRNQFTTLYAFAQRLETTADGLATVMGASPIY
jgi:hypothetical protein